MSLQAWLVYLVAVVGLSVTPGPNSLLVLAHGALHGHRMSLFTVAGGTVGFVALLGLSMLGIGALLQAASGALVVLKLAGGAYLAWLGVRLWQAPPIRLQPTGVAPVAPVRGGALFRQGLLAAISNPKVLLFYAAFLPQFVDPARALLPQFAVMAATFACVEAAVEVLLARLAHRVRPWLERTGRRFNQACGGLFVAMGAALPLTR